MIIPDKEIYNDFIDYEPIFKEYCKREQIYSNIVPYHELKNGPYHAFYVLEGVMYLKITGPEGEEKISAVLKHGSFFTVSSKTKLQDALISFISAPSPEIHMLLFTREEYEMMLLAHPNLALDIIHFYEDITITLQCELKDILFFDGRKRLCRHLYACYLASGTPEIHTTQEEIGKHIGLDRTNVAKYLSELRKARMIETGRNRIILYDVEGIFDIARR